MVAAGLLTMDGRHGGTYPSCPLSLGLVSGRAAWAACPLRLIPGTFRWLFCEHPYRQLDPTMCSMPDSIWRQDNARQKPEQEEEKQDGRCASLRPL
jgi:hypothetical protein